MKKKPNLIQNLNNITRESEKKKRILSSAIKVFGEKGFQNATIAGIAKDAGIGDATIYEYFKNKEDLLLAVPVEITKELIPNINDHMMGIKEGQEEGTIKKEIDVYLARSLCVGAIEHIIIRWLLKDRRYSLIQYADPLTDLLIDSFKTLELEGSERVLLTSKGKCNPKE